MEHAPLVIDIARSLAAVSPALGSFAQVPQTLLSACNWQDQHEASKTRDTNTLLALRALANLFLTDTGRKGMCGGAEGILGELSMGKKWDAIGARKVPLVTIALK
jgi:phospholipase A-2-activating protein